MKTSLDKSTPKDTIRIGTRDSQLALWQAARVKTALEQAGHTATLVPVKSDGDRNLSQPLYEMGITGIFTKTLDVAMLQGEVDIAVHSMKDVPTALPQGIVEGAVLKRASHRDLLLCKDAAFLENPTESTTIATGSLRRKAQWLHRYPEHRVVNLRGNVNSRLQKLADSPWAGAIFAQAGLERLDLLPENAVALDWMLPAPAQGAMLVVAMENNDSCRRALAELNHAETAFCVAVERAFLRTLEGGCTAPIGALAQIENNTLRFEGALFSLDGKQRLAVSDVCVFEEKARQATADTLGRQFAERILEKGGKELIRQIRDTLDNRNPDLSN